MRRNYNYTTASTTNRLHFAMEARIRHACPGKNGKNFVEVTPPVIFNEICSGCVRNAIRVSAAILKQRDDSQKFKDSVIELKKSAQFQLHVGLNARPSHLRGITDLLPICTTIGVDEEDLIEFHRLATKAAKKKQLSKLFDFVAKDGSTFRAIKDHTARF